MIGDFLTKLKDFFKDLITYLVFLKGYFSQRFYQAYQRFESAKGFLVGGLVAKRGKYIRPFLHTSMSGLFLIGLMLAPLIKSSLPQQNFQEGAGRVAVLALTTLEESTTTQVSVKPRDSIVTYTVRPGDTVSSIAVKFGISEETILWQNNLTEKSVIKPGEKLEILPATGISHKVKRGETIYSIAKTYSTEAQNIVNWPFNTFTNDETFALATGQLLIIPDAIKPKEKVPEYIAQRRITPSAGAVSATGQFVWPASGSLTQYFAWYHPAIDIANKTAPDILAADSGTVVSVISQTYAYGNHIIIDHGNGFTTLYAHLTSFYVSPGQTVNRGDSIGKMGCTGRCTGTHLHFEIRQSDSPQNPLSFLK